MNAGVYRFSAATEHGDSGRDSRGDPGPRGRGVRRGAFGASLNNGGQLAFSGIVPTDKGLPFPEQLGLGLGIFRARKNGTISSVVSPGDAAPGGGTFDFAFGPWINNRGDVAFMGHVAGDECLDPRPPAHPTSSSPASRASTSRTRPPARFGPSPTPVTTPPAEAYFRQAISPVLNDWGDIPFLGDLTPPPAANEVTGVYLHRRGATIARGAPWRAMPGGGAFVTASTHHRLADRREQRGEVVFNAALDTDANADGFPDTGLYVWSHGSLRLVARTGTEIPGVGTVAHLVRTCPCSPPPTVFVPNSGANNNDRGQVVFGATLSDGRGVLLLATPKP